MADVAAIFHWPMAEIAALPVEDLFAWRDRAVARWNHMHGSEQ